MPFAWRDGVQASDFYYEDPTVALDNWVAVIRDYNDNGTQRMGLFSSTYPESNRYFICEKAPGKK